MSLFNCRFTAIVFLLPTTLSEKLTDYTNANYIPILDRDANRVGALRLLDPLHQLDDVLNN